MKYILYSILAQIVPLMYHFQQFFFLTFGPGFFDANFSAVSKERSNIHFTKFLDSLVGHQRVYINQTGRSYLPGGIVLQAVC